MGEGGGGIVFLLIKGDGYSVVYTKLSGGFYPPFFHKTEKVKDEFLISA
jgi:hypothetical protein